jgi:hypothetical protein
MYKKWDKLIWFLSAEWLLTRYKISNGGSAIIFRSLYSGFILFFLILGIYNLVDPTKSGEFSLLALRTQVIEKISWLGILIGTLYAGLYARFSSQWIYLANLYNNIKRAQTAKEINEDALAEWKAAFIEDAEDLHLAYKTMFSSIINAWARDSKVVSIYEEYTLDGKSRLTSLLSAIRDIHGFPVPGAETPNKPSQADEAELRA